MTTAPATAHASAALDSPLALGGRTFRSRLIVGTGKYRDYPTMQRALDASVFPASDDVRPMAGLFA